MSEHFETRRRWIAGRGEVIWKALDRVPLERLFLVIALTWGVAQALLVPPLQVPDEGDHWFRAWAMTDGQLTADSNGMVTLPATFARTADLYLGLVSGNRIMPPSLAGQPGFSSYEDLFDGPGPPGTIEVASRVANYGPIGYLPQAAGVAVGRLLGTPPLVCFYLARLANLLVAIAILFFAIRLAPYGKQLFMLLALLPVTMLELASVSCDALTIAGAMLLISVVLRAMTLVTLGRAEVALLLGSAAAFLNVKPGYWALILLVLLIRPSQLGSRGRYAGFVAASVSAVVGLLVIDTYITRTSLGVGGPNAQVSFILHQPLDFLGIVWAGLPDMVFRSAASVGILGWMTLALPPVFYAIVTSAGFSFFLLLGEDVHLGLRQRALMAVVGVGVAFTIAIALYVFLEPIGSRHIGFQGRYLVPVWLLLLLSAYGFPLARRHRGAPLMFGILIVMMVLDLGTVVTSYYP